MIKNTGSLSISNLELPVYLGWSSSERRIKQVISLDITIHFLSLPKACITDKLNDTVCYSTLIQKIRDHLVGKKFNLIEHVCHELYQLTKPLLPKQSVLTLTLSKRPKIPDFSGKVSFCYSNE